MEGYDGNRLFFKFFMLSVKVSRRHLLRIDGNFKYFFKMKNCFEKQFDSIVNLFHLIKRSKFYFKLKKI